MLLNQAHGYRGMNTRKWLGLCSVNFVDGSWTSGDLCCYEDEAYHHIVRYSNATMILSLTDLVFLAAILRISQLLYRRFFKLRCFRGPALAAYTRLWLARAYSTEKANDIFLGLNKTYGTG